MSHPIFRLARSFVFGIMAALCVILPAAAQDSFQLPADLYVLTQDGRVERYAPGQIGATPVTPTDAFILDFGVDGAGERLAYRTDAGLFVLLLNLPDVGAVQIEGGSASVPAYRGRGETIAWSPTGDAIAYTTLDGARVYFDADGAVAELTDAIFLGLVWSPGGTYLAAEGENDVWWVYRRDTASTLVLTAILPSSAGTTFVSNAELVFAPAEGGLRLMNLEAANAQTLILDESVAYRSPTLTTDDALAFFARPLADAAVQPGDGVLQRLVRGAAQIETLGDRAIPLNGLRWTPAGTWLVAFQGGVLALIDPRTGDGVPFSVGNAAAYAWGPLRADAPVSSLLTTPVPTVIQPTPLPGLAVVDPTVIAPAGLTTDPIPTLPPAVITFEPLAGRSLPAHGFFLAPDAAGIAQVWRLTAADSSAFAFTGATTDVTEFTSTADGSAVAYVAAGELWVQRLGVRQPVRVAALNGFAPIQPAFSPDGTQIAYTDETPEAGGIWIARLDGGDPRRVLATVIDGSTEGEPRTFRRPVWSPDGTRLLVSAYAPGGGVGVGVLTLASGGYVEAAPESNVDGRGAAGRWLADGRIVATLDASATLDAGGTPDADPTSVLDRGFYLYDGAAPGEAPVQWIPLPGTALVRSVQPVEAGRFRVLIADINYPDALLRVVEIDGAAQTDLLTLPALTGVRLSPDAAFAAGLAEVQAGGAFVTGTLVVADLTTGALFALDQPDAVRSFRWAGQ